MAFNIGKSSVALNLPPIPILFATNCAGPGRLQPGRTVVQPE